MQAAHGTIGVRSTFYRDGDGLKLIGHATWVTTGCRVHRGSNSMRVTGGVRRRSRMLERTAATRRNRLSMFATVRKTK
jgi:hypothetical protein